MNNFERVYAFVALRGRDRRDADDLRAEVFKQALANLSRFEWRGTPFVAWLYRIAANAIADHVHERSREADMPVEEIAKEHFRDVDERASLYRLVNKLPADQQRVIAMRFAEGKSIREIATEMKKSEGAIKQLQWRGLESLRAQMGAHRG
jgi:RNA polymerase sigma-70 factor (ECF subfamily)